jgi:hypothetical protein
MIKYMSGPEFFYSLSNKLQMCFYVRVYNYERFDTNIVFLESIVWEKFTFFCFYML